MPTSHAPRDTPTPAVGEAGEEVFDRALSQAAVLVVDDEPGMCNFLKRALEPRCALVEVAGSAEQAEALRLRYRFDVLVVDIRLPGLSGLDWLSRLRERGINTPVVYMTAYADLDMSIQALRHGAGDFVIKPFRTGAMRAALRRALQARHPPANAALQQLKLSRAQLEHGVVGDSAPLRKTLELVQRVAPMPTTVLIQGETGSGKELIARLLHALDRRPGAFVPINCAGVPPEQFESVLFGEVRGAVAQAERGTLFLDDVGELPLELQGSLLRVLDERVVRPVGAEREHRVDVRVVASTCRDLSAMVRDGRFREDLWFRLDVMPITVPPLRDRLEDLPALIDYFLARLSAELGVEPVALMHSDLQRLRSWHWPGNARELRNLLERTLLLGRLPPDCCSAPDAPSDNVYDGTGGAQGGFPLEWPLDAVERAHMRAVLASTGNNKSAAARSLGVSRKTLERKQQQWDREDAG